jgi:hypothetical protein
MLYSEIIAVNGQIRVITLNVFLLGSFSTLKMEATYSSETSVDFQRTTRRYIPEDSTVRNSKLALRFLPRARCFFVMTVLFMVGHQVM